jgi:hypothetical protein
MQSHKKSSGPERDTDGEESEVEFSNQKTLLTMPKLTYLLTMITVVFTTWASGSGSACAQTGWPVLQATFEDSIPLLNDHFGT